MELTSKDKDQLETFKKCLGLTVKIGKKSSGFQKENNGLRVQFCDVLFYQWLVSIGLMPNKSKTLRALKIPDKYFFDFLRGCFDGDGSIYAYWDRRWRSSYMFYISIASASPIFLKWLQQSLTRLLGVKGRISRGSGVQQLRFAKKETLVLFKAMYYVPDIPYLKRKFAKAQKIFTIDRGHRQVCPGGEI